MSGRYLGMQASEPKYLYLYRSVPVRACFCLFISHTNDSKHPKIKSEMLLNTLLVVDTAMENK